MCRQSQSFNYCYFRNDDVKVCKDFYTHKLFNTLFLYRLLSSLLAIDGTNIQPLF